MTSTVPSHKKIKKGLYIESYGCAMNFSDSEIIATIMAEHGYSLVNSEHEAQVMFIKNDLSNRWVNGTLGRVHSFDNNLIKVDVINGPSAGLQVDLGRETWRKIKYQYSRESKRIDSKETGSVMQFPLTLAWAVTIHKSQGATYERVNIDLGTGAFADGQTYVALSRCRSPQGISLAQPIRSHDIRLDPKIVNWREQLQRSRMKKIQSSTVTTRGGLRSQSSESSTS